VQFLEFCIDIDVLGYIDPFLKFSNQRQETKEFGNLGNGSHKILSRNNGTESLQGRFRPSMGCYAESLRRENVQN
jgi:hypothetical protein